MKNLYTLPRVIGCPFCENKADTSQPVRVVLETNRMDPQTKSEQTIGDFDEVVATLVSGLLYLVRGTPLMVQVAGAVRDAGHNVVCFVSDSWTAWLTSTSSGMTQPVHFVCGCETPPASIMGNLQKKESRIVIYDVNEIRQRDKDAATVFQANFQKVVALGKKANTVFLVEEAALKQGPADLLEAAINKMPELAKVSSVA